jgi:Tfp pilus assembly protein PilE
MIVMEFSYVSFVLSAKDALAMAEIMQRAEKYEKKYRREDGGATTYTYHAWPNPDEIPMKLISDDIYRMAKLAGKPEKE